MSNPEEFLRQMDLNLRVLSNKWKNTKSLWNDPVSRHFEDSYMASIENQTKATTAEMAKLSQIMLEARRRIR